MDITEHLLFGDSETCVIEGIDVEKRTGILTLITEGYSLNGRRGDKGEWIPRYYTAKAVEDIATLAKSRYKIFAGHEMDELKRMDRNIKELVATVVKKENGERDTWTEKNSEGKLQAKARIRFSHYDVGQQTMQESRDDIDSVRASINGIVHAKMNTENESGKKEDRVEGAKFLFSSDIVSYDAAGGGMSTMEGQMLSESVGFQDLQESQKEEVKEPPSIEEAFKSIKARIKEQEMREKWWTITSGFNQILREVITDKSGDYDTEDKKKSAYDMASGQLKEALFELDFEALKNQWESKGEYDGASQHDINNNPNSKEKQMFDSVEAAAKDENVRQAVLGSSSEVTDTKTKLATSESEVTKLKGEVATEKTRADEAEKKLKKYESRSENETAFDAAIEAEKLAAKHIYPGFRDECLSLESDVWPDNYASLDEEQRKAYKTAKEKIAAKVKAHKEWIESQEKEDKDDGNTRPVHPTLTFKESKDKDGKVIDRGSPEYEAELKSYVNRAIA